jgi:1-deoxy-D-xylulose-5-phosphate synthase
MPDIAIQGPEQLRSLSAESLQELADRVRQLIITTCIKNGGHIGASLGAVELAVALHSVFESPSEAILWDVGHQAYAHKIITGRWQKFLQMRQLGGISGFLNRQESPHDVFGAGHSSTALSAALAVAWANKNKSNLQSTSQRLPWTVAVVGDGGMTAGLAFEALNQFRTTPIGPLLLVINDNQMSISKNVGAIPDILASENPKSFFELFGFDYVGPIDGHDISKLIDALTEIKAGSQTKPVVLHARTIKGKGYKPAIENPSSFHGIGPTSGISGPKTTSYSEKFGEVLCKLAEADKKIVAITAAMTEGTGLSQFKSRFPNRFFDVGIAEAHAVTFAAGLATQGYRPVVAIYSTFFQRALDSMIHDVALQNLGVTFAIDRAGLVGADGPTHHGVFDIAYFGMVPQVTVTAPTCLDDLSALLSTAVSSGKPWVIRYPRGSGPENYPCLIKDGVRIHSQVDRPDLIVIGLGNTAQKIQGIAELLGPHQSRVSVISTSSAKPIASVLKQHLLEHPQAALFCIEDGVRRGGFGEGLLASLPPREKVFKIFGYRDHFIGHGSVSELEDQECLSKTALIEAIRGYLNGEKTT